jgi:hypothetical protein
MNSTELKALAAEVRAIGLANDYVALEKLRGALATVVDHLAEAEPAPVAAPPATPVQHKPAARKHT